MNSQSKVDDLLKKQAERAKSDRQKYENLKIVCKEVFSDTNGKFFLKFLKKCCGWNDSDRNINPETLIYQKGRRDIWNIVRNILPKDILAQIEIYDEGENEWMI